MQKSSTSRNKHYLCLLLPNGECLQTVITNHYSDFFDLDLIANIPTMVHSEYEHRYTWTEFSLEEFDIERLGGT